MHINLIYPYMHSSFIYLSIHPSSRIKQTIETPPFPPHQEPIPQIASPTPAAGPLKNSIVATNTTKIVGHAQSGTPYCQSSDRALVIFLPPPADDQVSASASKSRPDFTFELCLPTVGLGAVGGEAT